MSNTVDRQWIALGKIKYNFTQPVHNTRFIHTRIFIPAPFHVLLHTQTTHHFHMQKQTCNRLLERVIPIIHRAYKYYYSYIHISTNTRSA